MALGLKPIEIVNNCKFPLLDSHQTWCRVLLDKIAEVQNGYAFKSSLFTKDRGIPLIRIRDVGKQLTDEFYNGHYEQEYLVQKGDILIGMDGDFKCATWNGPEGLLNQRVCRVALKSSFFNNKFLIYLLQPYLDAINAETSSVTVKHLSSNTVKEIPLPLPPLPEQHRIVAKIEELFSELDKGVEALKTAQQQLKVYRQAVLKWAFEGKLTEEWRKQQKNLPPVSQLLEQIKTEREKLTNVNGQKLKSVAPLTQAELAELPALPDGWKWIKAGQLYNFVTSGSRGWAQYYSESGAIFIRITNLDFDSVKLDLDPSKLQYVMPPEGAEGLRTRVTEGDLLFSITGYLGMFAIAPKLKEAYINQHIALCRPVDGFNKLYLGFWAISKTGGNHYLNQMQKGATKAGLGLDDIRNLIVPFCALGEQNQIVQEIETRLSVADKLEETITQSLEQAETLRQSILKKAFAGKLVPQDPNDEPASKLLERIKVERASQAPVKRAQ